MRLLAVLLYNTPLHRISKCWNSNWSTTEDLWCHSCYVG